MLADGIISPEKITEETLNKILKETEAILEDDRIAGLH